MNAKITKAKATLTLNILLYLEVVKRVAKMVIVIYMN